MEKTMGRRAFVGAAGAAAMAGAAAVMTGGAARALAEDGSYTAGTYDVTENGHNGPIDFTVRFSDTAVTEITTGHNLESEGVGLWALDKLSHDIIAYQTLNVDAVTGATVTSHALLAAVEEAAEQAGGAGALKANPGPACDYEASYDADICVIGGGGAGCTAAITAAKAGAKVVVLEKCGITGGSTNVCGGALNAVDPYRQGLQGIDDSVEQFFTVTMDGGHNVANPELVRFMCEHAMESVEWLEDLGVAFKMKIGAATGSLGERSHYNSKYSGSGYTDAFRDYISANPDNITVLSECPATEVIMKDGKVAGARGTHRSGLQITVNAPAVIIATGGFGANAEYRQSVNTGVWGDVDLGPGAIGCSNISVCAQGDGLFLAQDAGAELIGLSDIQVHPGGLPGTGLIRHIHTSGRNRLFLNENGDRFVNEGAARDELARAVYAQPNSQMWLVVNKVRYPTPTTPDSNGETIQDMLALDAIKAGDTLEELAQACGMDPEKVQASVDTYNAVVRGEMEDPFGFKADNVADVEMTEGPWYACKKAPTIHHTMGGIRVNVNSEVETADGEAIPGLYAVGEVTGGIQGANRLGGNAVADCITFGRNAGEHASVYVGIDEAVAHKAAVVFDTAPTLDEDAYEAEVEKVVTE